VGYKERLRSRLSPLTHPAGNGGPQPGAFPFFSPKQAVTAVGPFNLPKFSPSLCSSRPTSVGSHGAHVVIFSSSLFFFFSPPFRRIPMNYARERPLGIFSPFFPPFSTPSCRWVKGTLLPLFPFPSFSPGWHHEFCQRISLVFSSPSPTGSLGLVRRQTALLPSLFFLSPFFFFFPFNEFPIPMNSSTVRFSFSFYGPGPIFLGYLSAPLPSPRRVPAPSIFPPSEIRAAG